MSLWRSILDAALESTARASLRLMGRDINADEDKLLPQSDRDEVVNRCHDLRRNNPVAAGVAEGLADNVVGSRLMLQARTSNRAWNADAEAWFRAWAGNCETSGRCNFAEVVRHAVRARLFDGELFCIPQPDGKLTLVESQRVRPEAGSNQAYRLDAAGRVTAWRIADRDPRTGEVTDTSPARWVPSAFHVAWRWRPDQVRGWPQLATVANAMQDLGEINAANLKKYKMGALAAWCLTGGGRLKGRNTTKSDSAHPLSSFRDGMIYELEEGQQLQPFQNNQPGGEYSPFVELNLRLIGMAVRLPYEFLLQYFGGGTFASSKAALEQVHVTVAAWQDWIEDALIRPVMAWRVAEAIRRKELPPAPVDSRGRSEWDLWQWQRPAVMWLDPQAAIQAEMQEIRMGVGTLTAAAAERGLDLEETFRQRAAEMRMAADIEEEYGLAAGSLSDIQIPGQTPTPVEPVEETPPEETEAAQ